MTRQASVRGGWGNRGRVVPGTWISSTQEETGLPTLWVTLDVLNCACGSSPAQPGLPEHQEFMAPERFCFD